VHLFETLSLAEGSLVLDAGCGVGHVAIHMAQKGLRIQCIDVVDRHIQRAKKNIGVAGLSNVISLQKGDYHHLDAFKENSFEGAYTMETFVHATDPDAALVEFYRVLKPGGKIALYEYDHNSLASAPKKTPRFNGKDQQVRLDAFECKVQPRSAGKDDGECRVCGCQGSGSDGECDAYAEIIFRACVYTLFDCSVFEVGGVFC
jgi:SAM-dependent methyltransferase